MHKYTGTDNLEVMKEAKNYNKYLIELITQHTSTNSTILDFGAGIGTFATILNSKKYKVSCLEPDLAQCETIKKFDMKAFQTLDEIEDNSLDFIYSLNVLEHIEDDLQIIKNLKEKLKDDGAILLYLPAFNILFSSMDKKVGHFRRYDFKMLENLAKSSELKIDKLYYVDSLGFLATLVYKLFGNKDGDINKKSLVFYDKIVFPISQKLDKLFNKFIGKNVYMVAKK